MSPRRRPEEKFVSKGDSLGVIDIRGSPIHWVGVEKADANPASDFVSWEYFFEYGIPDPTLSAASPKAHLKPVRPRSLRTRVEDLYWHQDGLSDRPSLDRLNSLLLTESLYYDFRMRIESFPQAGCWILIASRALPSRNDWDCYERIACCLTGVSG
jgi:hypothetical protein